MEKLSTGALIIYCLTNFIYLYVINSLFQKVLGTTGSSKKLFLINLLYYICILFSFLLAHSTLLNLVTNLVFMFLISLTYNSSMFHKVITCVILLSSLMGIEVIVSVFAAFILRGGVDVDPNSGMSLFLVVLSKMILLLFSKLIAPFLERLHKDEQFVETPAVYWISVAVVPIANMLIIHTFYLQILEYDPTNLRACISVVVLVIVTLLVFVFYEEILVASESKAKLALKEQQIKDYIVAYRSIQETANTVLEEKHNLKNEAISLLTCLEPGDQEAVMNTRIKLQELIGKFKNLHLRKWSHIPIVDAVMNVKFVMAESCGVQFKTVITVADLLLDDNVISVILGNALDNAIEACQNLSLDKRIVEIIIANKNSNLFISISNPYQGEIEMKNGLPVSTKENLSQHGFGLRSIERLVSQEDGVLDISTQDDKFCLSMLFYKK